MTDETLKAELDLLKESFGEIQMTKIPNGATLVRITSAPLPKGCSPVTSPALLTIPASGRPTLHVKPKIKLSNGVEPRSTSVVSIEGEEWLQFSYNFPWDEKNNTLLQFVAASLQRFAKLE